MAYPASYNPPCPSEAATAVLAASTFASTFKPNPALVLIVRQLTMGLDDHFCHARESTRTLTAVLAEVGLPFSALAV